MRPSSWGIIERESTEEAEAQDVFDSGRKPRHEREPTQGEAILRLLASLPRRGPARPTSCSTGPRPGPCWTKPCAEGDPDKLADVIRRFLHTRAGYEASLLAGRFELARGRPLAAALALPAGGQTAARASPLRPRVVAAAGDLLAVRPAAGQSDQDAGRPEAAHAAAPTSGWATRSLKLFADDAQALGWLQALLGQAGRTPAGRLTPSGSLFRGNAQRNGKTRGSLPLMNFRWRVPTPDRPEDEKIVEQLGKQYRDEGRAALPALQPLAVGGTILIAHAAKLLGVDFQQRQADLGLAAVGRERDRREPVRRQSHAAPVSAGAARAGGPAADLG